MASVCSHTLAQSVDQARQTLQIQAKFVHARIQAPLGTHFQTHARANLASPLLAHLL
jgi:hypothetical protein